VYVQQKAVYGTIDAARLFTQGFKKGNEKLGWVEIAESILLKRDEKGVPTAVQVMHVDDLQVHSDNAMAELRAVGTVFETEEPEPLLPGNEAVYTGIDVALSKDGTKYLVGQGTYAAAINTGLSERECS
jgi:BRCT domain type II-containing protein